MEIDNSIFIWRDRIYCKSLTRLSFCRLVRFQSAMREIEMLTLSLLHALVRSCVCKERSSALTSASITPLALPSCRCELSRHPHSSWQARLCTQLVPYHQSSDPVPPFQKPFSWQSCLDYRFRSALFYRPKASIIRYTSHIHSCM
jgi:hypothetical protein